VNAMNNPTKLELLAQAMEEAETKQLAELADHPNPAISVHRMLPGHHYGAVLQGFKVVGYVIRTAGEKRTLPLTVAKRLVKGGQCSYSVLGDLWLQSNPTGPHLPAAAEVRSDRLNPARTVRHRPRVARRAPGRGSGDDA
jgi:hypothetical protein